MNFTQIAAPVDNKVQRARRLVGTVIRVLGIVGWLTAASGASGQPLSKLVYQQSWVSGVQYAGLYLAQEKGYFKEVGLDVEFAPGGPNVDATLNVVTGKAMVGDRPTDILITARGRGMPIKVIGSIFQYSPMSVMSLKAAPITTLQGMVGKTVAVSGATRPIFTSLLKNAGIDPTQVKFVPVGTDPSILAAKQVDGYTGLDTNQGSMLRTKGVDLNTLLVRDMGYHIYTGAIYTTEDYLAKHRRELVAFLQAATKGHQYLIAHPEEAAKLTVDKFAGPGMNLAAATAEAKASIPYITDDGRRTDRLLSVDPVKLSKEIQMHVEVGSFTRAFAPSELVDPSLVRDAHIMSKTAR